MQRNATHKKTQPRVLDLQQQRDRERNRGGHDCGAPTTSRTPGPCTHPRGSPSSSLGHTPRHATPRHDTPRHDETKPRRLHTFARKAVGSRARRRRPTRRGWEFVGFLVSPFGGSPRGVVVAIPLAVAAAVSPGPGLAAPEEGSPAAGRDQGEEHECQEPLPPGPAGDGSGKEPPDGFYYPAKGFRRGHHGWGEACWGEGLRRM
mmetsp:Transcript_19081/g.44160  ORF Transcript_19081/g.44160 Transcript_19081/m.44160 type:complete len:204 (-) Transcript_19081:318-929(-)